MARLAPRAGMAALLVSGALSSVAQAAGLQAFATRPVEPMASAGFRQAQSQAANSPDPIREGAALFSRRCADCHGPDAAGGMGPDLTALWTSGMNDALVFETVRFGRPGSVMPPSLLPDGQVQAMVAYLKSLGIAAPDEAGVGDATHGEEIFRSTCAQCHHVNGQGGRLGPDLSRIAETRSRAELRATIRYPSATVAAGYRTVALVTRDGQQIRGTRKGEDAFSVQIVDTDERLQGYLKADLQEVIQDKRSLMPEFGPDRLSDSDLDDLLQYLRTLRKADGSQR